MDNFTPFASTIGGILIGLSASMMLVLHGRIAGISGIIGGGLTPRTGDIAWRMLFVGGLVVGGVLAGLFLPSSVAVGIERSTLAVIFAGLLVGFGTRMGNGCTSGHGICGLTRFSPRSAVAVATFMATGMVTAFVVRTVFGGVL